MTASRKVISLCLGLCVFLLCVWYIKNKFIWREILEIAMQADLLWLIGAGATSIVLFWFLRTLRWFILLRNLNIRIKFFDLYLCNASSLALSIITPFQSGEMIKVELLKNHGMAKRSQGYSSFLVERLFDLYIIITIAIIGITSYMGLIENTYIVVSLLALLSMIILSSLFLLTKIKMKGKIGTYLFNIKSCVKDRKTFIFIVILTVLSWIVVGLGWEASLYSISVKLEFQKTMALMPVVGVISTVSFVPGALGVAEVSIAEGLIRLGQSTALAQAGAVILRGYSVITLFLGIVHFLFWRIYRIKKERRLWT